MLSLKGIDIILIDKVKQGVNDFGENIYETVEKIIPNVIISPTSNDDVINTLNLTGKKAIYTLGIPKGDTNDWEDKEIIFFNKKWHSIGFTIEGIEDMIPTQWHKKVMVERYE